MHYSMEEHMHRQPPSPPIQRLTWVLAVFAAFLGGYVLADDERIDELTKLEIKQQQIQRDIAELRHFGQQIQNHCAQEVAHVRP